MRRGRLEEGTQDGVYGVAVGEVLEEIGREEHHFRALAEALGLFSSHAALEFREV